MANKKIGIFGGTFDPITVAHMQMIKDGLEWGLDVIYVIVAARPAEKQDRQIAPEEHRNDMVKAAVKHLGDDRVVVLDVEIDRPGVTFTVDTVRALRFDPSDDVYLMIGGDSKPYAWKEPAEVARRAPNLLVAPRPGVEFVVRDQSPYWRANQVHFLPEREIDLSSTEVRKGGSRSSEAVRNVAEGAREIFAASTHYPGEVQKSVGPSDSLE